MPTIHCGPSGRSSRDCTEYKPFIVVVNNELTLFPPQSSGSVPILPCITRSGIVKTNDMTKVPYIQLLLRCGITVDNAISALSVFDDENESPARASHFRRERHLRVGESSWHIPVKS